MKRVLLIATGGTIASKNSGGGLAPALNVQEILDCVPELNERCEIEALQLFHLDSTNIYYRHWLEIAAAVEQNYDQFDGFVITHGTDTMAYTAAALSYLIQNNDKPVVLTGSQKSVYLRDTDARKNLSDAFSYCLDDNATGVHIVFDGSVILGTRAKKTRTRSYNAFSSVDFPEIAVVRDGVPFYYIREEKTGKKPMFYHKLDPNVFVLKMVPGLKADIFDYLSKHYNGLILETFGSGGLPNYSNDEFFAKLRAFLQKGKTVVVTTQVEREGSALFSYEVGRKLLECGNVLEAGCMTLEAAFAKLMYALAIDSSPEGAAKIFTTPVGKDMF